MFVEHRRAFSCSPITSPSYGDLRLPATSSSPTTVAYLCATLHIVLSNGRLLIFMRLSSSSSPTGGCTSLCDPAYRPLRRRLLIFMSFTPSSSPGKVVHPFACPPKIDNPRDARSFFMHVHNIVLSEDLDHRVTGYAISMNRLLWRFLFGTAGFRRRILRENRYIYFHFVQIAFM